MRGTLDGLDRLTPDHLTDPVVLKPLRGNGSSGVVLLEPDGAVWTDRLRRRKLTFDELIAYERHILKVREFDDLWLLESPLVAADPGLLVPDDFKIYAFQGEVGLIVQRRGWAGGYDRFDPEWDRALGAMWESAEPRIPHRWRPVLASVITGAYPSRSRWLVRRR